MSSPCAMAPRSWWRTSAPHRCRFRWTWSRSFAVARYRTVPSPPTPPSGPGRNRQRTGVRRDLRAAAAVPPRAIVATSRRGGPGWVPRALQLDVELVHLGGGVPGTLVYTHDGLLARPGREAEHLAAHGVEPRPVEAHALLPLELEVQVVGRLEL